MFAVPVICYAAAFLDWSTNVEYQILEVTIHEWCAPY